MCRLEFAREEPQHAKSMPIQLDVEQQGGGGGGGLLLLLLLLLLLKAFLTAAGHFGLQ